MDAWCGCVEEDVGSERFRFVQVHRVGFDLGSTGFDGFEDGPVFTPCSEVGEWAGCVSAETPE